VNKSKLTFLFSTGENEKYVFESDEKTNELYINGRKILTEVNFSKSEKFLAWGIGISVFVQAMMAILTFCFK
jgi:hypothetical protein